MAKVVVNTDENLVTVLSDGTTKTVKVTAVDQNRIIKVLTPGPKGDKGDATDVSISGTTNYIPVFSSTTTLGDSTIFQSGSFTSIRNATTPVDPTNPDILYVNGDNIDTYNLISAHGNRNNYLQTNVQNFNNSTNASSDVVATADNGNENSNYIDMGINSSGYDVNSGIVGDQNDAYLYSTGNNLLIGNASSNKKVIIFNGGLDSEANARIYIHEQGTVSINTNTYNANVSPALEVQALNLTTTNIINAYANNNDFVEVAVTNASAGTSASADFVAYNDIDPGNQEAGYVDMGINSSTYVNPGGYPGSAGDAYLYTDSEHLILGSISGSGEAKVTIFAGGDNEATNAKLILYGNNQHQMTGSLNISGGLKVIGQSYITGGLVVSGSPIQLIDSVVVTGSLSVTGSGKLIGDQQITGSLYVTQSHISTVDWIDFTIDPPTPTHLEGRIHWNADRKTLQVDTDVNNFMIATGHVNVIRGKNTTNGTLTAGTVVYITGNSGQFATFGTASWDTEQDSAYTIGIIAQSINQNNSGYAVIQGEITGINTNAYAPGTLLYLSSSGQFSDTKPAAPLHTVRLGQVVVQSNNGSIQVKVDNGYETDELHDVLLTNDKTGDLFVRSGSLWINTKQLTGSYGLTGSLSVSGSITATTLTGTASFATTSSYALTASYALNAGNSSGASGFMITTGSVTASVNVNSASFQIKSGSSTFLFVSNSGFFGFGVTASTQIPTFGNVFGAEFSSGIRIGGGFYATSNGPKSFAIDRYSNNAFADEFAFRKARGTGETPLTVTNNDELGGVEYYGHDGTSFIQASRIYAFVDGGVSTNSVPGRFSIFVNNGQSSIANVEAIRVNSSGSVGIKTNPSYSLDVSGSGRFTEGLQVTGSLNAPNITGSVLGTSSWAVTASHTLTASHAPGYLPLTGGTINGNIVLNGTASIAFLNVTYESSSVIISTGSNVFGDAPNDSQTLYGTVSIPTGSLTVSGSTTITGSLFVTSGITGSLFGTSSWSINALTASYFVTSSVTSASFASTASFINPLRQDVIITGSLIVSGSPNPEIRILGESQFTGSVNSLNGYTGSLFGTASWANNSRTGSYINDLTQNLSITGSVRISGSALTELYVLGDEEITGSLRITNGVIAQSVTASIFGTSSWATNTLTASYVNPLTQSVFISGGLNTIGSVTSSLSGSDNLIKILANQTKWAGIEFGWDFPGAATAELKAQESAGTIQLISKRGGSTSNIQFIVQGTTEVARIRPEGVGIFTGASIGKFALDVNGSGSFRDGLYVSSSFVVTGSARITGSLNAPNITGSLFGTSSWSQNSVTASFITTAQTASFVATASWSTNALTASYLTPLTQSVTISGSVNVIGNITGSRLYLSSSNGTATGSTLIVYGSGSSQPVFSVQGSQGELFSVSDSLSGSLFSVNDISGLPVIEAFSDNRVLIGSYQAPALYTTVKTTSTSGNNIIYSIPTSSYDGAFFDYTIRSGSNARAGQMMAIWSASVVNFTETVTTDFGDTTSVRMTAQVTGSSLILTGSFPTANWTMKTIIRSI